MTVYWIICKHAADINLQEQPGRKEINGPEGKSVSAVNLLLSNNSGPSSAVVLVPDDNTLSDDTASIFQPKYSKN